MEEASHRALFDELEKIAFFGRISRFFRERFTDTGRAKRRVDYHFSPKAGPEKWDKFVQHSSDKNFVKQVQENPNADDKLKTHSQAMYDLAHSRVVGHVTSSKGAGKKYEIKSLPGGRLGCTCPDWRYVGSVNPVHDCKHIRAHRAGMTKVSSILRQVRLLSY